MMVKYLSKEGLSDLLYVDEHVTCDNYVSDYRCSFRFEVLSDKEVIDLNDDFNYLFFLLEGKVKIEYNGYPCNEVEKGHVMFLPRAACVKIVPLTEVSFLYCMFDVPYSVCDKLNFMALAPLVQDKAFNFSPVKIRAQFDPFIDSIIYYLRNKIHCAHLHEIKQSEMFLIFRWFYPKMELAELFHPMIAKGWDFRDAVLRNYKKVNSVNELARMLNMSRSSFDVQFRQEFEMPPQQWMLKQKANYVRLFLSQPDVTIADAIMKFSFNSSTHFTRFCKQHLGQTPKAFMRSARKS